VDHMKSLQAKKTKGRDAGCPFPRSFVFPEISVDVLQNDPLIQQAIHQTRKILQSTINVQAPALSFGIVYNQTLLWGEGFGSMNFQDKSAPTPTADSIYKIASQTKVFTALMLLMARDDALVNLQDSVSDMNPQFRLVNNPFNTEAITFQSLATQLSGLPRTNPCGGLPQCNTSTENWNSIAETVIPIWEPNQLPSYSNLGFSVLGRTLEMIVDQEYESFIVESICQPLGMNSSGFLVTDDVAARMPSAPDGNGQPIDKYSSLGFDTPAGGMFTSVNDMAKFISKYFSEDNEVILSATLKEQLEPHFNDYDGRSGIGMPFEIVFLDNVWIMSKGGDIGGYHSMTGWVKSLRLGFTLMEAANTYPTESTFLQVMDVLITAFKQVIAKYQATFRQPPPDPSVVIGCYSFVSDATDNTTVVISNQPAPVGLIYTLQFNGVTIGSIELNYKNTAQDGSLWFQFNQMQGFSCAIAEVGAYEGQYVLFKVVNGQAVSVSLPATLGAGLIFQRC